MNGKKASGNEKLAKGDCVKLFLSDETIQKFSEAFSGYTNVSLDILYEDADIILINKPVGMLSQKAARSDESLGGASDFLSDPEPCTDRGGSPDIQTFHLQPSGPQYKRNCSGREKHGRTAVTQPDVS